MKQEKALVSRNATNAIKPRPAVPFEAVLFRKGWCCFGDILLSNTDTIRIKVVCFAVSGDFKTRRADDI